MTTITLPEIHTNESFGINEQTQVRSTRCFMACYLCESSAKTFSTCIFRLFAWKHFNTSTMLDGSSSSKIGKSDQKFNRHFT